MLERDDAQGLRAECGGEGRQEPAETHKGDLCGIKARRRDKDWDGVWNIKKEE